MERSKKRIWIFSSGIFFMLWVGLFFQNQPTYAGKIANDNGFPLNNDFVAKDFFYNAREDRNWQLSEVQASRLGKFKNMPVDQAVEVQLDNDIYGWSYSEIKLKKRKEKMRYQDVSCGVKKVSVSAGFEVVSYTGLGSGSIDKNNRIKLVARQGGLQGKLEIKYEIVMDEVWKYAAAFSDDGYIKAFLDDNAHYTFDIGHPYPGAPIIGYVTVSYDISSKPTGTIISKDAKYILGEFFDQAARSRLLASAKEISGESVPYSDDKIKPTIPTSINQAKRKFAEGERIDRLFDDQVTLHFDSDTGKTQSTSRAVAEYGNAVILRGLEYSGGRDAGGAFALVTNDDDGVPKIVATSGASQDNEQIHSYKANEFYCGIAYLTMSAKTITNLTNISVKDHQWAKGDMKKQDFLDQWGDKRVQKVDYGDLIKLENIEGKIGYTTDSVYRSLKQFDHPDEGQREVFFEVTKQGFVPLVINQLKPLTIEVPFQATEEQLSKKLAATLDTRGNSAITVEGFSQKPTTDKVGATTAKVIASQKLASGKTVQYEYEIPVRVQEPGKITPQTAHYFLGEAWNTETRSRLLKSAKEIDGTEIPYKSDKIIPTIPDTITQSLKNERIDALFTDEIALTFNSATGKATGKSKATVEYGNALILRGLEWTANHDAAGAFALIKEDGLKIVATSGGKSGDAPIHDRKTGEFYTGIAYLSMEQSKDKDLTGISVQAFNWAKGETRKQTFLNGWGKQRVQSVKAGDLIKVENTEGKIYYTQNSTFQDLTQLPNQQEIFFEVTEDGYRPLWVNQAKTLNLQLPQNATPEELQASLPKFLLKQDQTGLKVEKYVTAPDTKETGTKEAKILVSQTLQSGKKVSYQYSVQVEVTKRGELITRPGKFVLGEQWTINSPMCMFVSAKEIDGTKVTWSNNEILSLLPETIESKLNKQTLGTKQVKRIDQLFQNVDLPIGFQSKTGYVEVSNKAEAGYGNAIVLGGYDFNRVRDAGGVFALIKEDNLPKIVATSGQSTDNQMIHSYFVGEPYFTIAMFRRNQGSSLSSLDLSATAKPSISYLAQGDTKKQDFLDQWGSARTINAQYGDIFQVKRMRDDKFYYTKDSIRQPLTGLVNPREVFFEITEQGYVPLSINQVAFTPIVVEHDTSATVIKEDIAAQLKKQHPELQIDEVKLPDLNSIGDSLIDVSVSEKSHVDPKRRMLYRYSVKLTINEGSLSFATYPQKIDFGTVQLQSLPQEIFCKNSRESLTVSIKDTRSQKNPWYLMVKESRPFKNKNGVEIPAQLLYCRQNKREMAISKNAQLILSGQEKNQQALLFSKQDGFFLKIPSRLNLPTADYQGGIQWILTDTPL